MLGRVDQHPQTLVGQQRAEHDHAAAGDQTGLSEGEGHTDDATPDDARY